MQYTIDLRRNRIVLYRIPDEGWVRRDILDERGTLAAPAPLTDIVFSTDPESTMRRVLGDAAYSVFELGVRA